MAIIIASCQRENIDEFGATSQAELPNVIVTSSVTGLVVNENGEGIMDASVSLDGLNTMTNEIGLFSFKNVPMSKSGAYVQVYKNGFFDGSRKFSTELEGTANIKIQLIDKELVDIVDSETGGVVEVEGSEIEFPKGNYLTASNENYNGGVEVYAKWLDPTNPETFEQMPGELTGVDSDGNLNALATYGMLGVELIGDQGEYLNLPEGETATIRMEVPADLLSSAPSVIPLWHFNEISGNWEEEGEAILSGNEYVGVVSHFSFWNCDAPFPLVEISGYVTLNGDALEGSELKITDLSNGFCAFGITGERGYFSGKVPEGSDLLLTVIGPCGFPLQEIQLGSFNESSELGFIPVDASLGEVIVSGTFNNCLLEEIELAFVIVVVGDNQFTFPVENDGSFYHVFPACSINNEVQIYGIDYTNSMISEVQYEPFEGEIELELEACDPYFDIGILVDYDGINWDPLSDTFESFIEKDVFDFLTPVEYAYSVAGIEWSTFLNDFVPVVQANFNYVEGNDLASYEILFSSQGFAISGECEVSFINQAGIEIIIFNDIWEGSPMIYDYGLYPGEIDEVFFDFSFPN